MSDDPRTADTVSALAANGLQKSSRPFMEFGGRKMRARFIDDNLRSEWETSLRQRAFREALSVCGDVAAATKMIVEMNMTKAFRWGGPLCNGVLATQEGGFTWAALILGCSEKTISEIMQDKVKTAELVALLDQIRQESYPDPQPNEPREEVEPNPTLGASV